MQEKAPLWFAELQARICTAFEQLEDEASGPFFPEAPAEPGRFVRCDHGRWVESALDR